MNSMEESLEANSLSTPATAFKPADEAGICSNMQDVDTGFLSDESSSDLEDVTFSTNEISKIYLTEFL